MTNFCIHLPGSFLFLTLSRQ
ncbi:Uncharacterized protein APZ42_002654 [Daphnia magna]|uniref:Uncharacterized protein n=1 Tax=Daphnia magna TaxID=35525 RepID=A0A164I4M5_9CRUS|nr:Uncharacterized protein APZ42_002654 [Daphnia magna]